MFEFENIVCGDKVFLIFVFVVEGYVVDFDFIDCCSFVSKYFYSVGVIVVVVFVGVCFLWWIFWIVRIIRSFDGGWYEKVFGGIVRYRGEG